MLWAAGVSASPLGRALGAPVDRAGRVLVEPDLSLPGHREVFVIGDLASLKQADGTLLPGVAPVAMQQGRYVARQIAADLAGHPRENFHYVDKGSLATIGRAAAIAQFGKLHISGFIAWLSWLFIHIFFLIGFRNRIAGHVSVGVELSHLCALGAPHHRRVAGHVRALDGICGARGRASGKRHGVRD